MPWKAAYPKEIRNKMIELVRAGNLAGGAEPEARTVSRGHPGGGSRRRSGMRPGTQTA